MTDLRETVARAIATGLGDNFSNAFRNKARWTARRGMSGGRFRDINEPMQPDYLDAADAAITAMQPAIEGGDRFRLMLLNLLAVIHRDGGHRTHELGINLSYHQAMQLSSERIGEIDNLKNDIKQARREALEEAARVAEAEINNAGTGDGWQSACNIRNEILALIEKDAK